MTRDTFIKLPGSTKPPIHGSVELTADPVPKSSTIGVTVMVRAMAPGLGAAPADIEAVEKSATAAGLTVVASSAAERSVKVSGPADVIAAAFGTTVAHYEAPSGVKYRAHTGHLHIPSALDGVVQAAFGFDTRPYAKPHHKRGVVLGSSPPDSVDGPATLHPHVAHSQPTGWTGSTIRAAYGFAHSDGFGIGTGVTVRILELSAPAGSGYRPLELVRYATALKQHPWKFKSVSVDGAHNAPGINPDDPNCADGEVALDCEIAASIAPGANFEVYFAPNTARGFVDVINRAINDPASGPVVISLSWGGAEQVGDPASDQINQILMAAAAKGVTVCVASGDNGTNDAGDGRASVDFPASSPFALACGGLYSTIDGGKLSERAWGGTGDGASGGGVSRMFALPSWQSSAGVPAAVNPAGPVMRGVPDVAGPADPATGWQVIVDGRIQLYGGTSAVAPMWAGFLALLIEKAGKALGLINPDIYNHPECFRDITVGTNGDFNCKAGWDPVTGLGSPIGPKLLALFKGTTGGTSTVVGSGTVKVLAEKGE